MTEKLREAPATQSLPPLPQCTYLVDQEAKRHGMHPAYRSLQNVMKYGGESTFEHLFSADQMRDYGMRARAAVAAPVEPQYGAITNRATFDHSRASEGDKRLLTFLVGAFRDWDHQARRDLEDLLGRVAPHGAPESARVEVAEPLTGCCHGLDTPVRVRFYEHDFYPLSNFSSFRVQGWGRDFDTSEHAYHWHKFPDRPDIQDNIQGATSAHEAFKYAEKMKPYRRADWDAVKVDVMRDILRAKVSQHEYVRRKLLATGERELVEDSWRDTFWGWGPNRDGENMLGRLWMDLRAALRGGRHRD